MMIIFVPVMVTEAEELIMAWRKGEWRLGTGGGRWGRWGHHADFVTESHG